MTSFLMEVDHMLVASPPDSVDWAPIDEAWRRAGAGVGVRGGCRNQWTLLN